MWDDQAVSMQRNNGNFSVSAACEFPLCRQAAPVLQSPATSTTRV